MTWHHPEFDTWHHQKAATWTNSASRCPLLGEYGPTRRVGVPYSASPSDIFTINRMREFRVNLLISSHLCAEALHFYTPKPRYHTLAPRQVPRSRRSRKVRFPSRSSAREKFDFREDLPDLLWITTSISRSAVRSSSDQVSVY